MTTKRTKQIRRKYDATFKAEVMKVVASGRSVSEIAEAMGIGENLVYQWKNADKASRQATINVINDGPTQLDLLSEK
ncbi:transposase [Chitinophaga sancti]|uniref:transposase n=1 Tax=Chitinophaga sancti TaxID=1004 RepID=UPI002A75FC06|nr:transposase [Chitinophaga sancti]WPQ66291.1 transposase [Chitinophaga sancti]